MVEAVFVQVDLHLEEVYETAGKFQKLAVEYCTQAGVTSSSLELAQFASQRVEAARRELEEVETPSDNFKQ